MHEEPCLDNVTLEKLRQIGGNEFVVQMIDLFLQYVPQKLTEARATAQAGDWVGVRKAVHPIKSSAANIGASFMLGLATRIEQLAGGQQGELISGLLVELEAAYQPVKVGLQQLRNGLAAQSRSVPDESR